MRVLDYQKQMRAIARALEAGAERKSAASFEFDAAGNCQNPIGFESVGRPSAPLNLELGVVRRFTQNPYITVDPRGIGTGHPTEVPLFLQGYARCRKCEACLQWRRKLWTARASYEFERSQRTWFVTFTLRPDRAFHHLELARQRVWSGGTDLDTLDSAEQFAEWCRAIGKELQLTMKRLRKNTGGYLRYLFVFERHLSGTPHIHGLIHESPGSNAVVKRAIESSWHDGFSSCRLVDKAGIGYVTKYLAKDFRARLRASIRYGGWNAIMVDRILNRPTTLRPSEALQFAETGKYDPTNNHFGFVD